MGPTWIDQAGAVDVPDVAEALGLRLDRNRRAMRPCPGCGADRREKRGAVRVSHKGRGWWCPRCNAKGDALDLVARVLHRAPKLRDLTAEQRADVRAWYAGRGWCDGGEGSPGIARAPMPIPKRPDPEPLARPEEREVLDLWFACARVTEDAAVAQWLVSRGLDPETVAARDLARALPEDLDAPSWARFSGTPWHRGGWRCIFPAYGPTGRMESLRARSIEAHPPKGMKAAAAAAGDGSATGLVLADAAGREVLGTGAAPRWWPEGEPLRLVVTEGEPDFLTWATRYGETADDAPAVLGVWSGGWTPEIAGRIPDETRVTVLTHDDDNGDHYADKIWLSLAGRCEIRRRAKETP